MPFRGRKSIPIIPGFVKYNFAVSAGKDKGVSSSGSWTLGILGKATYNTRDGRYRVNTPGWGWWESRTRAQRQKRKLDKRVAKVQAAGGGKAPARGAKDPQAAMHAKWFADLRREGVDPAHAAHDARRCEHCGNRKRPGQWCVPCAEQAAKEREKFEARTAARERQATRLYGPPEETSPRARPNAIDQYWQDVEDGKISPERRRLLGDRPAAPGREDRPRDPYNDDVAAGRMSMVGAERRRWLGEGEAEQIEGRERKERQWQRTALENEGGTCGAKTKDGTKCRNGAGCSIPSHRGVRL